jgi:hypothetical protein
MATVMEGATLKFTQSKKAKGTGEQDGRPAWMVDAEEYLRGVSYGEKWVSLVEAWLAFECALGYPDGQVSSFLSHAGQSIHSRPRAGTT